MPAVAQEDKRLRCLGVVNMLIMVTIVDTEGIGVLDGGDRRP